VVVINALAACPASCVGDVRQHGFLYLCMMLSIYRAAYFILISIKPSP
jgi:hypothetical protein